MEPLQRYLSSLQIWKVLTGRGSLAMILLLLHDPPPRSSARLLLIAKNFGREALETQQLAEICSYSYSQGRMSCRGWYRHHPRAFRSLAVVAVRESCRSLWCFGPRVQEIRNVTPGQDPRFELMCGRPVFKHHHTACVRVQRGQIYLVAFKGIELSFNDGKESALLFVECDDT